MQRERPYYVYARTALHVGSGRGVGVIDLPVARETTTEWPYIPTSAIKGLLSESHGEPGKRSGTAKLAFGASGTSDRNRGALVPTDARLLWFPVKSHFGTFVWVTSPMALRRYHDDLRACARAIEVCGEVLALRPSAESAIAASDVPVLDGMIYLSEYDLEAVDDAKTLDQWRGFVTLFADRFFSAQDDEPWRELFVERAVLVSDDLFSQLALFDTQIDAEIAINRLHGVTQTGSLRYIESVPPEAIFVGRISASRLVQDEDAERLFDTYCRNTIDSLQLGGKQSTGRGFVQLRFGDQGLISQAPSHADEQEAM